MESVYDVRIEEAYLASCIIGGKEAYHKAPLLPRHFHRESNKILLRVIREMATDPEIKEIDLPTVFSALTGKNLIDRVGGSVFLTTLVDSIPTSANIVEYARRVKELAQLREISQMMDEAKEVIHKTGEKPSTIAGMIEARLSHIRADMGMKPGKVDMAHIYDVNDMIRSYQDHIENLKKNTLKTGVTAIDNNIRGVAPGEVLTIVARAGSFKTAFLQNILKNHSEKSGGIAAFFSLEMPVPMVFERFQQIVNSYNGRQVEKAYYGNDADIPNRLISEKLKNIVVIPVKVSLKNIAMYIPLIKKKTGKEVTAIGIDYLGLVDSDGRDEYGRISAIATGAKDLAKEVNLPVVLLSQTSRKGGTGFEEITLDSGRGSGAIEEGADFVLGMWQREMNNSLELVCSILKNRKGKKGTKRILELYPDRMVFGSNSIPYTEQKTAIYE